jgi:hypothetical protein
MATQVTAQSGIRVFRDTPLRAPLDGAILVPPPTGSPTRNPATEVIRAPDTLPLEALATRMQEVSSQRQNGLVLAGDLQRQNGDLEQAAATYRNANAITATPAVRERIKNTREMRAALPQQ